VGYNLYLVKQGDWWDANARFGPAEWDRLRASRPLPDWVWFEDGTITVKSPTREQVIEFVGLARAAGWSVQGDDGEIYGADGVPVPAPPARPGIVDAVLKPLRELLARRSIRRSMRDVVCPFQVGDPVRTTLRTGGVVIAVDANANHGLGSIKVRFSDGTVLGGFFVGHDFRREG
jgi:hypothetical protein